ncbi:MAG: glycosyltransferase [Bacteroidia bacterium]|nr:glycosyltransferase [Bacteroidia bacterium]
MNRIVIGMCVCNNEMTVANAIHSVLAQREFLRELTLFISIDSSQDASADIVQSFLPNSKIIIEHVQLGRASLNRNYIMDRVHACFPEGCILGRLDADDEICDDLTLAKVEQEWDRHRPDVMLMGNRQRDESGITPWVNRPDKRLLDPSYLQQRLEGMAAGNATCELPSCNTFIRSTLPIRYPDVRSAEDHWFSVLLLLHQHQYNIHIAEELLYCIYAINGAASSNNKDQGAYTSSRQQLLQYFIQMQQAHEPQTFAGT